MHLCARDRLKERLHTACKELIIKLPTVSDNYSYMPWKREVSEKCDNKACMSHK